MKGPCPFCGKGNLKEELYTESLRAGRKLVKVTGLKKLVCDSCGEEMISDNLHEHNHAMTLQALNDHRTVVTRGQLRLLRERWDLSQEQASKIFGAGAASFAKWESGQNNLSTPSALLVRLALEYDFVIPFLASSAGIQLDADAPFSKTTAASTNLCPKIPKASVEENTFRLTVARSGPDFHQTPHKARFVEECWGDEKLLCA